MSKATHTEIGGSDFSGAVKKSLSKRGYRIVGTQGIPGPGGDWLNVERAYLLVHDGAMIVRTYSEVRSIAA